LKKCKKREGQGTKRRILEYKVKGVKGNKRKSAGEMSKSRWKNNAKKDIYEFIEG